MAAARRQLQGNLYFNTYYFSWDIWLSRFPSILQIFFYASSIPDRIFENKIRKNWTVLERFWYLNVCTYSLLLPNFYLQKGDLILDYFSSQIWSFTNFKFAFVWQLSRKLFYKVFYADVSWCLFGAFVVNFGSIL